MVCILCKICLCDQWNIADVMTCPSSDQIIKDSANIVLVTPTVLGLSVLGAAMLQAAL